MRAAPLALLLACIVARPATAQDTTAGQLARARDLYERLELERALPLLREVVSSGWAFDVSAGQRVEANLYLGATLVLLGARDSAVVHFRAALERDPFADLDPARFTPAQVAAFQAARRSLFAIGVRPVPSTQLDPRTGRVTFTIAATHAALVRCDILAADGGSAFPLFQAEIGGMREIEWDGVLANGQLAATGRYALRVQGVSRLSGRADSARVFFDVRQQVEALEDTLPDLRAGDLLPERYRAHAATADLLKGLGVAAGAFLLANTASSRSLGRGQQLAVPVAGVGVAFGVSAFVMHRNQSRPDNVASNERRRAERLATNEQIRRRNSERLARTLLLVSPAAGTGN